MAPRAFGLLPDPLKGAHWSRPRQSYKVSSPSMQIETVTTRAWMPCSSATPKLHRRCPLMLQLFCPKMHDGLFWRSRTAENGIRRAKYYIEHLLLDAKGKFSHTLAWIAKTNLQYLSAILPWLCSPIWCGGAWRSGRFCSKSPGSSSRWACSLQVNRF